MNNEYETPPWLFKALDAEFGFTFDAAANEKNAVCRNFSSDILNTPGALLRAERVFCNPPYSTIHLFTDAALAESGLWVMLLPVRTDSDWFRRLWESKRCKFRFLRKRIRFCLNGVEQGNPRFASMIVIVRSPL